MCVHVSGPVLLCKQRGTISGNPACSLQRLSDTRACQAALEARRDSPSWTAETWEAPTPVSSSPTSWLRIKGQDPTCRALVPRPPAVRGASLLRVQGPSSLCFFLLHDTLP